MIRHSRCVFTTVLLVGVACAAAAPVRAQTPAAISSQPADADDDARLDPAEPDFSLVNLPSTLRLPRFASNFHLTHRFNENLRRDSFSEQASNLFGLDEGATIGLEYRFGIMRHLQAIAARTNFARTVQLSARYDAVHQSAARPLSASAIVALEGQNNFQENYAPAVGAVLSRTVAGAAAVYLVPVWVHNSASGAIANRNTGYLGIGARVRVLPTTYLVGEVSPRLGGYVIGDPEFGFSVEKRVGAHVFALTFANGHGTTYSQIARGGNPQALYFGFNLTRKFF